MHPLLAFSLAAAALASCQPTRTPPPAPEPPPVEQYEARYRFHRCTGEHECHACTTCVKCRLCHQLGGTCGIKEAKAAKR